MNSSKMIRKILKNHNLYVVIGYIFITLLLTYPLLNHFSTHIPGLGCDAPIFFWNLWWIKKALIELKTNPLFCSYIFYPTGINLGASPIAIFNGLISIPLQYFFSITQVYNIIIIFSFTLSGYGTYLLANYLVKDKRAAFIAGFIFAFCPYKFHRLFAGHINLVSTEWIPFYILCLIKLTKTKFSVKYTMLSGFFLLLNALCSYYYFNYLLVFTLFYWVYILMEDKDFLLNIFFVKKLVLFIIIPIIGLIPILYSSINDIIYSTYKFGSYSEYISDLLAFFIPSIWHPLWGKYTVYFYKEMNKSGVGYIGYSILFLLFYGILKLRLGLKEMRLWIYSTLIFFIFSLGVQLHIWGNKLPVILPSFVFKWIPIFSGMRDHSRFTIIAMLSLSIIISYILRSVLLKVRFKSLVMIFIISVVSFEYLHIPIPLWKIEVPKIYKSISSDREDFSILEIPLGWQTTHNLSGENPVKYQLWQTVHNKKLIAGSIARAPDTIVDHFFEIPFINNIYALQENIPCKRIDMYDIDNDKVIELLRIKYIIIHAPLINSKVHEYVLEESQLKLKKVYEDKDIIAYKILRKEITPEELNEYRKVNIVQYKYGWWFRELWDSYGICMHWSKGKKSLLSVYLDKRDLYKIKMRAIPFPMGSSEQIVKIFVNNKLLCEQKLREGWNEYLFSVQRHFWKVGENLIKFRYKYSKKPVDIYEDRIDVRDMAMGVDYIKVEREN